MAEWYTYYQLLLTLKATLSALCNLAEEPRVLREVRRYYST